MFSNPEFEIISYIIYSLVSHIIERILNSTFEKLKSYKKINLVYYI